MNEKEREEYLEKYTQAKKKGIPFFPDAIYKDAIISLLIFIVLVGLAFFVGAQLEERADPLDTTYTPRPEWYFLFLFQLLKYFPGDLEVIGVFVIPTLAILLLIGLPFIDRNARRHFSARLGVSAATAVAVVGVIGLTLVAMAEAPPPVEVAGGDPVASLYTNNCAPCHGSRISVPTGLNLREVIARGRHEGMPAWGGDLTSDEIDALAGFILSPDGSTLFNQNCSACHDVTELVSANPLDLTSALEEGTNYPAHADLEIPEWTDALSKDERTALLNFLIAPDGQRLFTLNCSSCHGGSVAFDGTEEQLRDIIVQGGRHLEMPSWRGTLHPNDLELLAAYVVDPSAAPSGSVLFERYCVTCHPGPIPSASDRETAREIIATGGGHETMPIWGDVLTDAQLNALVAYTSASSSGAPAQVGQTLFSENCAVCHGDFGEGGVNPTRPDDIIAPISSAEFLRTRDDITLRSIISQGQPNIGMSPFGTAFGGPLDDDQIDAIIAFFRTWEENPPVEFPPDVVRGPIAATGSEIFRDVCSRCHGTGGQGLIGPILFGEDFRPKYTDQELFDTISLGHEASAMIPWGEILTSDQIAQLVDYIRQLDPNPPTPASTASASFAGDVVPILEANCIFCHGTMGGWDATTYETVIHSGNNGPVVIPGDSEASLLIEKLLGTQTEGGIMPPGGSLPESDIQLIIDWIDSGAQDN
jgi:mono/diheme cytochrome c family protein